MYQNRSLIRLDNARRLPYTFEGGLPEKMQYYYHKNYHYSHNTISKLQTYKTANCISGHFDVLKRAQNVDFRVGQHNASFGDVFNGEHRPAVFTRQAADCARQVFAF